MHYTAKLDKQAIINLDFSNISKRYPAFAYNVMPFLAIQPPIKNAEGKVSASAIVAKLKSSSYSAPYGEADWDDSKIPGTKILEIWKFLHYCKTKDYHSGRQTAHADISSGVPLVLYAYKHQYNIPYNAWDRSDPLLVMLLTDNLKWLVQPDGRSPSELVPEGLDLRDLTEQFLTTGTTGIINGVTNPKASLTTNKEFNNLPKYMRYMLLQTWIYHPSVRHENMITDWDDWDAVRPARGFEGVIAPQPTKMDELPW